MIKTFIQAMSDKGGLTSPPSKGGLNSIPSTAVVAIVKMNDKRHFKDQDVK